MLGYALRVDDHVIHIYLNVSSDLMFKDSFHQSLVCRACIFKAEKHDPVAKFGIFSDKFRILLVRRMNPGLVISKIGFQEA